ncbi:hypothetical protein GCM10010508_03910 [Streptomyces naganishii JCM 4654]|uniref:Uncharacterized protein n=1 Tax=Streptomyces naganishii JCM 4654 TaxID=1306179 RepID=A0A919CT80_9ACTN|nr:hypothetical protein GCM10010508_03910 [Streptomyces naganishii JCM 4654]
MAVPASEAAASRGMDEVLTVRTVRMPRQPPGVTRGYGARGGTDGAGERGGRAVIDRVRAVVMTAGRRTTNGPEEPCPAPWPTRRS